MIKIVSVTSGNANIDIDGSGNAASDSALTALGINTAERQQLAAVYSVGQSLWRVPLDHFSPWDSNWSFGPPADAKPPQTQLPKKKKCKCPGYEDGSIIDVQNQGLSESVDLTGTPFYLHYDSELQRGYRPANSLAIELSTAAVPTSLKRISLRVDVAGRTFTQDFPNQPNQTTFFDWDGKDAFGRTLQGGQPAVVNVGYVYDGVYQQTGQFGYNVQSVLVGFCGAHHRFLSAALNCMKGYYFMFGNYAGDKPWNCQEIVATGSNGMYLSVTCAEDLPLIKPGEGERNGVNTFLGDYRLRQQRAACALWPRGKIPNNYAAPTRADVPALILIGQWDPVTPPIYGDTAAKYLSHSLHLIVPHGGHGFNGLNGLDCINNLIVSFIDRGTTTGLGTSCVNSIGRKGFLLKLPDSNK